MLNPTIPGNVASGNIHQETIPLTNDHRIGHFPSHRHNISVSSTGSSHSAQDGGAAEDEQERSLMGAKQRKGHAKDPNNQGPIVRPEIKDAEDETMNRGIELRRKGSTVESPTANLIGRSSFTLDDPVPDTPKLNNHGFFELPKADQTNFCLLVLLYFLQGVPMGLAFGSVPFLLKPHMSYGALGVFSLASYPYSLKLLWSPIVDAVWSPKLGRRKSWIMPIQALSGLGMVWLGSNVKNMMFEASKDDGAGIWGFTGWWFFLVFMCATQDIAVDGWAITLLTPSNISYASTAQTVGLTAGHFMSYTIFLAFNSPDFANKWFRSVPLDEGVMTLGGYLTFWGWIYIMVTIGLALFKREDRTKNEDGIMHVYKLMWGVLKLPDIQTVVLIRLICKIGFQANDGVANLKLIDKGFSQEDMALTVLIDFPFEIILGFYAGKWCQKYTPIRIWCWAFPCRLLAAILSQLVVVAFPSGGVDLSYLTVVIVTHIFSTFTNTVMFVAGAAFDARISDPAIGGTYMTLLATVSNFGGTFPRYFILKSVDYFTVATCRPPPADYKLPATLHGPLVTHPFSCAASAEKDRCLQGGGVCDMQRDGYYVMNIICVLIGVISFWGYIRPQYLRLQSLPLRAWRIAGGG